MFPLGDLRIRHRTRDKNHSLLNNVLQARNPERYPAAPSRGRPQGHAILRRAHIFKGFSDLAAKKQVVQALKLHDRGPTTPRLSATCTT